MAAYSDLEQRLIAAAKRNLEEDQAKARRQRMLDAGLAHEEADRRIAQSKASRLAHLRAIADPDRLEEFTRLSKAQSEAARRAAGTSDRLTPEPGCEGRTLEHLRDHGPSSAIAVARAVSGRADATKAYINPVLYRLASRGEVALTERGWSLVELSGLKVRILDFLDDTGFNVLELSALLGAGIEQTKSALEELLSEGALTATPFATPSGAHTYYGRLLD